MNCHFVVVVCRFVRRRDADAGGWVLFRSIFEKERWPLWCHRLLMIATR